MSWKFPEQLRQKILDDIREWVSKDPELCGAPFTPEEFVEAFARLTESNEWPGSTEKDPKKLGEEFKAYCERIIFRELRRIMAARGRRN